MNLTGRCGGVCLGVALALALPAPAARAAADDSADTPLTALPYAPSLDVAAMDRTADPCVDFYRYSCGGWMANNPIPADQPGWSVFAKLAAANERFLWGILLSVAPGTPRTPAQQKIGDHFAACMDEAAVEARGIEPLAPLLAAIDGIRKPRDLAPVLARLHTDLPAASTLFAFGADQDLADSTRVVAVLAASGLGLPDRDYYTDPGEQMETLRGDYRRHVARVLELSGVGAADSARQAQAIVAFETELAKARLTRVERRDPYKEFHPVSARELRSLAPSFDWSGYFSAMGLKEPDRLNVTEPAFLKAVERLLRSTRTETLRAYLRWHAVHDASRSLSSEFVTARFEFYGRELRGVAALKPRWKRCVEVVDEQLGDALGAEFVARAFSEELKKSVLTMTAQIETAMRDDIAALDWMSPETKAQAAQKLGAVINKIGYPDRWLDYSTVDIRPDQYFENTVRANRYEIRRTLGKIGKAVDRGEWSLSPPTVNAFYSAQMNDITFPAGVLQPPLYDPKTDAAPNYGNTGGTIGHELTHGFDDLGRHFDATGSLRDWWAPGDVKKFAEHTHCVVDQYADYVVVDDIHINSRLTLGEDIADLGGLMLAYVAWRHSPGAAPAESREGLSGEQRFFVGYAQWACENNRPETLRLLAKTDPHSPGRYRVNGLMPNIPEFAAAFSCKPDQPMVSKKRCRVW